MVADAVNPVGTIVRTSGEVVQEGGRLIVEGIRIKAEQEREMAKINNRQANATEVLKGMRRDVDHGERNAQEFRGAISDARRNARRRDGSAADKERDAKLLIDMAKVLARSHTDNLRASTGQIHEVLNGGGAADPRPGQPNKKPPRQKSAQKDSAEASPAGKRPPGASGRSRKRSR